MKRVISLLLTGLMLFMCGFSSFASEQNLSTIDVLERLGADGLYEVRANPVGDVLVPEPVSRINFNSTSYALIDSSNSIVRINRLDEIDALYAQSSAPTSYNSSFTSTDELINFVKDEIIGDGYVLTQEYYFDSQTRSLRYERELSNGALDNYDTYTIHIDETYNELISLYKSSSNYIESRSVSFIPCSKAIDIARDYLGESVFISDNDVELATVKTNHFFDNSFDKGEIRLAYIVKTSSYTVYVDAFSGDIIGGDLPKAILGGAIGAEDISVASDSVSLAKSILQSIGYNSTSTSVTAQFKTVVPQLLKYAFYSCSHGSATAICSNKSSVPSTDRTFFYTDVPSGTYKLVFLDACNTASTQWKNAFGISDSSTDKAFLGWSGTVNAQSAYEFCLYFWGGLCEGDTVRQVALDAALLQGEGLPISFTGDRLYNGFY